MQGVLPITTLAHHAVLYCKVIQYSLIYLEDTARYAGLLNCTILCYTVLYCNIQYLTALYCNLLSYTLPPKNYPLPHWNLQYNMTHCTQYYTTIWHTIHTITLQYDTLYTLSHYITLYHNHCTVSHCSIDNYIALYCTTLQYILPPCTPLCHTAIHTTSMNYTWPHCNIWCHLEIRCSTHLGMTGVLNQFWLHTNLSPNHPLIFFFLDRC